MKNVYCNENLDTLIDFPEGTIIISKDKPIYVAIDISECEKIENIYTYKIENREIYIPAMDFILDQNFSLLSSPDRDGGNLLFLGLSSDCRYKSLEKNSSTVEIINKRKGIVVLNAVLVSRYRNAYMIAEKFKKFKKAINDK